MSDKETVEKALEKIEKSMPKKKNEKVVSGKVKVKKKSLGENLRETVFSKDTLGEVRSYIISDVILPSIKNALWNVISGGSEMMIFGTRSKSSKRDGYTPYDKPSYSVSGRKSIRKERTSQRTKQSPSDVIFESRNDASDVLEQMYQNIIDYGCCSVADFYELAGIDGDFTDNKYGWENLDSVDIVLVRGGGYSLNLPRAIII